MPWALSSAVTESTRKGMSSLTISTTVWAGSPLVKRLRGVWTRILGSRPRRVRACA